MNKNIVSNQVSIMIDLINSFMYSEIVNQVSIDFNYDNELKNMLATLRIKKEEELLTLNMVLDVPKDIDYVFYEQFLSAIKENYIINSSIGITNIYQKLNFMIGVVPNNFEHILDITNVDTKKLIRIHMNPYSNFKNFKQNVEKYNQELFDESKKQGIKQK